jgi:SAM-dependent methyltransferase
MSRLSKLLKRLRGIPSPSETFGLDYRGFVGPAGDYDLVAAMTFNLLTTLGLRQHHTLLDVGCGSLRNGRLLIPYLGVGNYTGIEPNKWLVAEGIKREVGQDQIDLKMPQFHFCDSAQQLPAGHTYDFALAQSIFSHCGPELLQRWLAEIFPRLKDSGALVATHIVADKDCEQAGWTYPGCVGYTPETIARLARAAGFKHLVLDWKHPRQTWALYAKPGFDLTWFQQRALTWNTWLEFAPK